MTWHFVRAQTCLGYPLGRICTWLQMDPPEGKLRLKWTVGEATEMGSWKGLEGSLTEGGTTLGRPGTCLPLAGHCWCLAPHCSQQDAEISQWGLNWHLIN